MFKECKNRANISILKNLRVILRNDRSKSQKQNKNKLRVKIYELNHIRELDIDLGVGKDRAKLRHILEHESHRLRKRDIDKYYELLNK